MVKKKNRKPRPSPPKYYWTATDYCWDCPNRNGCSGCKKLKQYVASHPSDRKRDRDFKKFYELDKEQS